MKRDFTPTPKKAPLFKAGMKWGVEILPQESPVLQNGVWGFTLVEMMVVVAVVAILTTLLIPMVGGIIAKTKIVRAEADLKILQTAMLSYRSDVGELPPRGNFSTGLGPFGTNQLGSVNNVLLNSDGAGWSGPYINSSMGLDSWGYSYLYDDNDNQPAANSDSFIASYGPNGIRDTAWFFVCNEPGCTASGDDIVFTVYNDND